MATLGNDDNLHFDIHASIVFQLGESLISDVVQALVELVKNAYDADATSTSVIVDTTHELAEHSKYQGATGYITIEDNGIGMDQETIERGWLTISNLLKRDMKRKNQVTERGRTPLGDKGLGRLGGQRLGYNVEIFTRPENSNMEYYVAFSWRDFIGEERLSQVPVQFRRITPQRKKGTKLIISDLKDVNTWRGEIAIQKLETQLSQLISPYKEVQDFLLLVTVDGRRLELAEITEQVRKAAQVRYRVNFDGEVLYVKGTARLDFFRPDKSNEREQFRLLVESDSGEQFFEHLLTQKLANALGIKRSQEEGWFIEYEYKRSFLDLDSLALVDGKPANPGPFHAEIDSFDLGAEDASQQNIFNRLSEYRKYIKELSGIKVYRDGFGIRVDRDWLKLGQQWTSGGSYYGLRPNNTLGFVALTARGNAALEETTDREGFKITPYYENFYEMLQQFIKFTGDAQEFLRRGWLHFRNTHFEKIAHVESDSTPEELSKRINEGLARAMMYEEPLERLKGVLEKTVEDTQQTMKGVEEALPKNTIQQHLVAVATENIKQSVEEARQIISQTEEQLQEISQLKSVNEVLQNQIEALREQLNQVYEIVSLGLTAEVLSHEVHNIADQLAERNQEIIQYLKKQNIKDSKLISFTEYIKTSIAGLRKQLSHLSPSLRYVRERRERIVLLNFFSEMADFYRARFTSHKIEIVLMTIDTNDFVLSMNRGKLIQVVDNLFLNSEFWLREDLRLGHITRGIITVEISKPIVRINDNGRGVDRSVETSLFEPFVSAKGHEKGRGLGLFIVQQILDSEGCFISLLPARNQYGRQYIFEIDFTGGLDGRK